MLRAKQREVMKQQMDKFGIKYRLVLVAAGNTK
jgi:hypothetical protein